MPVTATKVSPLASRFERGARTSIRQHRVARVSAKAAARPKPASREHDEEVELDPEAHTEESNAKPSRPDNGTYLSMYFRDMAVLDVLRPEEEFTSAREIEALEIMLWEAVLAHPPAIARLLERSTRSPTTRPRPR
jgi:hypothetical protein